MHISSKLAVLYPQIKHLGLATNRKVIEKSSIAIDKIATVTIFEKHYKIIRPQIVFKISSEIRSDFLRLLRLPRLPNIAKTIARPKNVRVFEGIFIVTK